MSATSASVERLFSLAGQVLVTAKRARLDPTTVTLVVFLHEAIPRGVEREALRPPSPLRMTKCPDTGDE